MTLFNLYASIWKHISASRKKDYYKFYLMTLINSLTEVISIGILVPFIGILTNPEKVSEILQKHVITDYENLKISYNQQTIVITILFIFINFIIGVFRLYYLKYSNKISYLTTVDLSADIFNKLLDMKYDFYINKNSNDLLSIIHTKSANSLQILSIGNNIIASSLALIFISIALIKINPLVYIIGLIFLTIIYIVINWKNEKEIQDKASIININLGASIKSIREAFENIKEVLINSYQNYYVAKYKNSESLIRIVQAETNYLNQSVKIKIEVLVIILMALLAIYINNSQGAFMAMPTLLIFAFGIQRVLPHLQQINISKNSLLLVKPMAEEIIDLLDSKDEKTAVDIKSSFSRIEIQNLCKIYDDKVIFNNINLTIERGKKYAITGKTGIGKSTLIDIIMGISERSSGKILIDDQYEIQSLRKQTSLIAHVPQKIFIADSSILENIIMGDNSPLDMARILYATNVASIDNEINSLPGKYDYQVGESGSRISGGQKQRIGIARGLYRNRPILILDECTSNLDKTTSSIIIGNILEDKSLTVLFVTHDPALASLCDVEINLERYACVSK